MVIATKLSARFMPSLLRQYPRRNFLFDLENNAIVRASRRFTTCETIFHWSTPGGPASSPARPESPYFLSLISPSLGRTPCGFSQFLSKNPHSHIDRVLSVNAFHEKVRWHGAG